MRLAWFAPDGDTAGAAALRAALRSSHHIDEIDARAAHEFIWRHARDPYDLCVYELDDTPAHQFVWAYLVHYPGVTRLHRVTLQTSRADALERDQRLDDFAREFAFSHPGAAAPVARAMRRIAPGAWPMLAVPLLASRITVVAHEAVAETLRAEYPAAHVRAVTPGVQPRENPGDAIVMAAHWPVHGAPLVDALAGFAAGHAVVVFDGPETADWPSLNPQDWQPRSSVPPICVAIDPRDEGHSRRAAMTRLEKDAALRAVLGEAARRWWQAHATVERAAAALDGVLQDAAKIGNPARPEGWPSHLSADGLGRAREVVGQFGLELPF
jgi:hypothetical protein